MYTAIVPARSGSKRLPGKNVRLLGDKPLLIWSLEACVQSQSVERVILSTDSQEYWDLARKYIDSEKLVLDLRTGDEAGDNVKIFDYLKNSAQKIFPSQEGNFILCLPTMPLRTASHIEDAILLAEKNGKPVFSAVEYDFSTSFAFSLEADGAWKPSFRDSPMLTGNTRSQDQVQTYHPNGAIYIRSISDLADAELTTLYQGALPYIMDRAVSVDIDTLEDFRLAEITLEALRG